MATIPKPFERPGKPGDPMPTGPGTEPQRKRFIDHLYDKETNEYCGRTCTSWLYIITYGVMYLLCLSALTLIILYVSLVILKTMKEFKPEAVALIYPISGVGLTAIPSSESNVPLIWYKTGEKHDYEKYVQAIDNLLSKNNINDVEHLGPCGQSPYGYGESPCVLFKINKHFQWTGKPLQINSSVTNIAPSKVRNWMKANNDRLWLKCNGYHSYDKEHIGTIKYYPDPPGFDPDLFPLHKEDKSPLVAIQISDFTKGISLAIECKLWYEDGPSSVDFVLYVAPNDSSVYGGQTNFND